MEMIYELREYRIREGRMEEWVELMDRMIIPFQEEMGMTVVGSFTVPEEEGLYVWIRRFPSREARRRLYDRVYGSDTWKNEIRPAMGDMLIREEKRELLLRPTAASFLK